MKSLNDRLARSNSIFDWLRVVSSYHQFETHSQTFWRWTLKTISSILSKNFLFEWFEVLKLKYGVDLYFDDVLSRSSHRSRSFSKTFYICNWCWKSNQSDNHPRTRLIELTWFMPSVNAIDSINLNVIITILTKASNIQLMTNYRSQLTR